MNRDEAQVAYTVATVIANLMMEVTLALRPALREVYNLAKTVKPPL